MKDTKLERARRNAAMLRRQFLHGDGGLFDQVLDDQTLATVFAAHGKPGRDRVYPPRDTLRLFIGQVLSADRACQDVVGRRLSERLAHGQPASALNTGSYCDARSRLPLALPTTNRQAGCGDLAQCVRWHHRFNAGHPGQSASLAAKP